jgi:hypothetical protein
MSTQVMSKQAGFVKLVNEFLNSKGSKFVAFDYTTKETDYKTPETSRYTVLLGVDLKKSYQKDIAKLEKVTPANEIEAQALSELLTSMKKSVETDFNNPNDHQNYEMISKNVGLLGTELYLRNVYSINRKVLVPGKVKKVKKSAEKTIAKENLKKNLRQSKIRTFNIDLDKINSIAVNGKMFEIV